MNELRAVGDPLARLSSLTKWKTFSGRGRWEKIGFWLLLFPVIPAMILIDIFEALGLAYWGSVVIVVVLLVIGMYVLSRPV